MKKILVIVVVLAVVISMSGIPALAATSPFQRIMTDENTIIIQSTTHEHSSGLPAHWEVPYGIGYTSPGTICEFPDLDFGANGASQFTVGIGFSGTDSAAIEIMIDDPASAPVGRVDITDTGGWDDQNQKDFTADVSIPGGVHTVYVKWSEQADASGSLYSVLFTEAAAPATTATVAATTAPATDAPAITTPTNPQTGDANVLWIVLVAITAAAAFFTIRRIRSR